MKKLNLIFLFLLITGIAKAQLTGEDYAFTSDYIIKRVDPFTNQIIDVNKKYMVERGYIFTIRTICKIGNDDGYIIRFWKFTGKKTDQTKRELVKKYSDVNTDQNKVIGQLENDFSFFISVTDLKANATNEFKKPKDIFKINGIVLPIKMRFGNSQPGSEFDFSQSISIGPALSVRLNPGGAFGNTSYSFLTGLNITNVSVDENTVAHNLVTSKTTLLALSPFIGFNADYHGVSISVMTGYDVIPGQVGRNWAYRNSPWIGVGIGTSIFSTTDKEQK